MAGAETLVSPEDLEGATVVSAPTGRHAGGTLKLSAADLEGATTVTTPPVPRRMNQPRELTDEEAGVATGPITARMDRPGGFGGYHTEQAPARADAPASDYVIRRPTPGGGEQIRVSRGNPNEMADPLVQMGTATALGMGAGAIPGEVASLAGAPAGVLRAANVAGSAAEGAVANKALGGDADVGAALGLAPFAGAAGAAGARAARTVASKILPSTEKAIKNARGWVVKDIIGDVKGAATPTARKQLADDAENAATLVLRDRPLDKLIDRAESGNLERLQEAKEGVKQRLATTGQERIAPSWEKVDKALPDGGVRSGDLVDFLKKRSEDLRATGLTSEAAEADALDSIVGRLTKAKDWGGGVRYDPAAKVEGGALDGMETGRAIALLEKQKTGPTASALDDEIKRMRTAATKAGFNPNTIVPAQKVQELWADEAGIAYGSQGGINGTPAFERKLDVASHVREFRDVELARAAEADPRAVAEVRTANRDFAALKRIEKVLDMRINHAKANAQGASVPVGMKKLANELKHPVGFVLSGTVEAGIAGKHAFDKWLARRATTPAQADAVKAIFAAPVAAPAVRAAVSTGVPSSIALWAARAARDGMRVQEAPAP